MWTTRTAATTPVLMHVGRFTPKQVQPSRDGAEPHPPVSGDAQRR